MKPASRAMAGSAAAAAAVLAYGARCPRSSLFAPSVWRGCRDRRAVALTFDDGPSEVTSEILEILDSHKVRATFFQCGLNVERRPAAARAVREAGHEIGNHSHTHPLLALRSARYIEQEFSRAQQVIREATGFSPRLLRAPFGVRWFGFHPAQRRLDLLGVMWTVIGYDWKLPPDGIVSRVLRGIGNGAIVCLHDGRRVDARPDLRHGVAAVRCLVPMLRERGFQFETVSEILCPTI